MKNRSLCIGVNCGLDNLIYCDMLIKNLCPEYPFVPSTLNLYLLSPISQGFCLSWGGGGYWGDTSHQDRDREISPFGPVNEIGTRNILSLAVGTGTGILISPTNETGTGPYLVPGLSKVPGIFHWSCQ